MTDTTQSRDDPPRQEVDLYGEPVAEEETDEGYFEAYTDDQYNDKIFIAHYKWNKENGWVKQGVDRRKVSNLFDHENWPTD